MKNQRKIDLIVVHCSATRVNQDFPVEALEACHKARGFHSIGYHYYITKDGMVDAEILGHRDLPWVRKSCPCFDVKEWLKEIDFYI